MLPFVFALLPFLTHATATPSNHSDSLIWGTYRPGLYFGLRPRIPQSLMTGLIWFGTHEYRAFSEMRHACDQGNKFDTYTWTEYDPRQGGVQVLKDRANNLHLQTEWLKVPGPEFGGSWAARFKGQPLDSERPSRNSIIFYMGVEGLGGLEMESEQHDNGLTEPVHFAGTTPNLGDFAIRFVEGPNNTHTTTGRYAEDFKATAGKTRFMGRPAQDGTIWKAKDTISNHILEKARKLLEPYKDDNDNPPEPAFTLLLDNEVYSGSRFYAVQYLFDGAFEFDVYYENGKHKFDYESVTRGLAAATEAFDRKFKSIFPLPTSYPDEYLTYSKAVTSNLLGGIGYFYGSSIVDRAFTYEWDDESSGDEDPNAKGSDPRLTDPRELLTATPSRSFFPRGFYWDEGFHLLHIGAWDNDLCLEILKDWIGLIDEDGWVAREQILGEEARSRVPAEFVTQHPAYANPPTLAMAVTAFIERLRASDASREPTLDELGMGGIQMPMGNEPHVADIVSTNIYLSSRPLALEYLRSIYPALRRHYDWFRRTQRGQIKQYARKARSRTEAYRWRGRTPTHILTSGMDDYPRGPPHAGELHLDLLSWMGFFSRTMKSIAEFLGEHEDAAMFTETLRGVVDNIDDLHWDEEHKMYCDVAVNSDDESYHECHPGYLSIFPFLLGLLPASSPHLSHVLDLVRNPDHLWSPYGLRSLSKSHPLFGEGENYWRGPIWVQMNYLALQTLYKIYAVQPGPNQQRAKEIYVDLRDNVLKNVFKEYERTGYVWEQYDPINGEGRRSHPFTGWTSLVTLSE